MYDVLCLGNISKTFSRNTNVPHSLEPYYMREKKVSTNKRRRKNVLIFSVECLKIIKEVSVKYTQENSFNVLFNCYLIFNFIRLHNKMYSILTLF